MRGRWELSDAQWKLIEPILRPQRRADGRGRPWQDTRAVFNGILWVLGTGAQWRELPNQYPPYQTCHRRFQQWVRAGTLERILRELAKAIVAKPGWTVVVFPQIPLGSQPMNRAGNKAVFPGSYPVRMATLRAIYMDLATELGEQGFRWIFLVHNHGAPNHHKALTQASDYFHDVYGGTMVDLFGLEPISKCCGTKEKIMSAEQLAEDGFSIHAGTEEQSEILFLGPELIPESYKSAPSLTRKNFADLVAIAKGEGWPGYFGAPRLATAAIGAVEFTRSSDNLNAVALQILNGLDSKKIPRWADEQAAEVNTMRRSRSEKWIGWRKAK